MKRKILNIIIDIILMGISLSVSDYITLNIIKSENFWVGMGVYLVFYGIVFGAKNGIIYLWRRKRK